MKQNKETLVVAIINKDDCEFSNPKDCTELSAKDNFDRMEKFWLHQGVKYVRR